MWELLVFFVFHLFLPLVVLASAVVAIFIGRAVRVWRGKRLVPPALEPALARPAPRGKTRRRRRFLGNSAAAQRQIVARGAVRR